MIDYTGGDWMHMFSEYNFGFADSETEYDRIPELLRETFYDPNHIIEKLLNSNIFLLTGRKGTGKTAFASMIRIKADEDPLMSCRYVSLADFEFRTFSKLGNADLDGGSRFIAPWKLMLLLEAVDVISKIEIPYKSEFINLLEPLRKYGLIQNGNISRVVRTVSKKGFKIGVPKIANFEFGGEQVETTLSSPEDIADLIMDVIENINYMQNKMFIIVDGLDDAVRGKEKQLDTISGLIRSANSLNNYLFKKAVPIKFIVLVRPDVLNLCMDTDINKVYRDSRIDLIWHNDVRNPLNSDLMELVKLRLSTAGSYKPNKNPWFEIFPKVINKKDSWQFVLEHTLLRPRDILQFLIECKYLYSNKSSLSESETKAALTNYSEKYFLAELQNELVGFLSDNTIRSLPGMLAEIQGREFTTKMWSDICENFDVVESPRNILTTLYDAGYVGQISERGSNTYINFKYRDPHISVNFSNKFLIHRGMWKALNVI